MIRTEIQLYIVIPNTYEVRKVIKKYIDLRRDYYLIKRRNDKSETLKVLEQKIMESEEELFNNIIKARDTSLTNVSAIKRIGATQYDGDTIIDQLYFDEEEVEK